MKRVILVILAILIALCLGCSDTYTINTVIDDAIYNIERGDLDSFIHKDICITERIDMSTLTEGDKKHIMTETLMVLKVIRRSTPKYNANKTIATYDVSDLKVGYKTLSFIKYDCKWYIYK